MTTPAEPRYRIAHVLEYEPATWDTNTAHGHPAFYHVRYYNPANECENFPFGPVNQTETERARRDYFIDLADVETFTAADAAAMLAGPLAQFNRYRTAGFLVLELAEPADSAIRDCPENPAIAAPDLLAAMVGLLEHLWDGRKRDVKKDFSLMVAEVAAREALAKAAAL